MDEFRRVLFQSILRAQGGVNLLGDNFDQENGGVGLSEAEINALPHRQSDQSEVEVCGICLEQCAGSNVIDLPCQHFFHENCITEWLQHHTTCPICRHSLAVPSPTPIPTNNFTHRPIAISILPIDIEIKFIINNDQNNIVRTRWNSQTTKLQELFDFVSHLYPIYNSNDIVLSNNNNLRQSFRLSQSYASLQRTLSESGILSNSTFLCYTSL